MFVTHILLFFTSSRDESCFVSKCCLILRNVLMLTISHIALFSATPAELVQWQLATVWCTLGSEIYVVQTTSYISVVWTFQLPHNGQLLHLLPFVKSNVEFESTLLSTNGLRVKNQCECTMCFHLSTTLSSIFIFSEYTLFCFRTVMMWLLCSNAAYSDIWDGLVSRTVRLSIFFHTQNNTFINANAKSQKNLGIIWQDTSFRYFIGMR